MDGLGAALLAGALGMDGLGVDAVAEGFGDCVGDTGWSVTLAAGSRQRRRTLSVKKRTETR